MSTSETYISIMSNNELKCVTHIIKYIMIYMHYIAHIYTHIIYVHMCVHYVTYTHALSTIIYIYAFHVVHICRYIMSRICHAFLTHSFILTGDPPPRCEHYQSILMVHHILVKCPHLQPVRDDVIWNKGVMESFWIHHPQLIIKFLREGSFDQKFIFHFYLEVFYCWLYLSCAVCDLMTVACPFWHALLGSFIFDVILILM